MTIYTVTQINAHISDLLRSDALLKKVMIRGEISNFKFHSSGHCYLTLKDENTAIHAVIFRRFAQKLRFRPENGMRVIACGSVSVYERDGAYQLYIEQLIADGAGALSIRYEQLKKQLEAEGLFAIEDKQALPLRPKCIGIITSRTGAVLHDIYTVASRRDASIKLLLYPVLVQGLEAANQLVEALQFFNTHRNLCDVIIIGRGGGSMEDLWSFNEETVVRAVATSQIPVVSAIGHETDYTLTDFASDVRAATPSQAAELCVPSRAEWLQKLTAFEQHLTDIVEGKITNLREQLTRCTDSIALRDTDYLLRDNYQLLDNLTMQLNNQVQVQLSQKENEFAIIKEKITLLDPQKALQRGYSVLAKDDKIIKTVDSLACGDYIHIKLTDGRLAATVEDIEKDR